MGLTDYGLIVLENLHRFVFGALNRRDATAQASQKRWLIQQTLDLAAEVAAVIELKMQPALFMLDQFRHTAQIGHNDRDSGSMRLRNHRRAVFVPARGNHQDIEGGQNIPHF